MSKNKIEEEVLSPQDKETKEEIKSVIESTDLPQTPTKSPTDFLFETVEELRKELAETKKTNDMLLEIADEKKLSNYYSRNMKEIPKEVRLRTIDGKVIIGWKTLVNQVERDPSTGRWYENQQVELLFEDGSLRQMHLLDFSRAYDYVKAKVLSTMINEATKETALKVERLDNKKQYDISITFIN